MDALQPEYRTADTLPTLKLLASNDEQLVEETVFPLFQEHLEKSILDWMGKGEIETIRSVLAEIRNLLKEPFYAKQIETIRSMPWQTRMIIRVEVFWEILAAYLRYTNPIRSSAKLLGKSPLNVLLFIGERRHPVTLQEVVDAKLIPSQMSAERIIAYLIKENLLEKARLLEEEPTKYVLSFEGIGMFLLHSKAEKQWIE